MLLIIVRQLHSCNISIASVTKVFVILHKYTSNYFIPSVYSVIFQFYRAHVLAILIKRIRLRNEHCHEIRLIVATLLHSLSSLTNIRRWIFYNMLKNHTERIRILYDLYLQLQFNENVIYSFMCFHICIYISLVG